MRKKNYSTNALNLKTMHILQQLNSKNSRNFSLSIRTQDKSNSKKMIAFLRRVAWNGGLAWFWYQIWMREIQSWVVFSFNLAAKDGSSTILLMASLIGFGSKWDSLSTCSRLFLWIQICDQIRLLSLEPHSQLENLPLNVPASPQWHFWDSRVSSLNCWSSLRTPDLCDPSLYPWRSMRPAAPWDCDWAVLDDWQGCWKSQKPVLVCWWCHWEVLPRDVWPPLWFFWLWCTSLYHLRCCTSCYPW